VAGALAGAVIGVILPGKALGRLGWAIVLGTGGGAIFGWVISEPKDDMALLGAVVGFALGFAVGLTVELAVRFPRKPSD
jgi:hypothetical protein